ncbi:hypothetical protein BH160DRAFT_7083 [Burkholderia sp. H160]|nr:hypothetical protein BH160DRAFT_7083 [Burkholderia sp. H160]
MYYAYYAYYAYCVLVVQARRRRSSRIEPPSSANTPAIAATC